MVKAYRPFHDTFRQSKATLNVGIGITRAVGYKVRVYHMIFISEIVGRFYVFLKAFVMRASTVEINKILILESELMTLCQLFE